MPALNIVSDEQAQRLVDRVEVLGIVEQAYRAAADGQARVSQPSALSMRGHAGAGTYFKVKGAVLDSLNVAGFRLIADGEQTSQETGANLYVVDATNGRPLGFVAEGWLHRIRTASTGLVTCRQLLPQGAKRLALIGTGRITQEFIRSCHLVLPQMEIVMASRAAERAKASAQAWRTMTPLPLSAAPIHEALSQADVVVTLSDAAEVLFTAADLQPHALVCAMGGRFEFDRDVLDRADAFIVDELDFVCTLGSAAHWIRSGQLTRADLEKRLDATIGELLSGKKTVKPGPALAIIQGMAICDLAIAKTVLDRAKVG